jgi:hypothetical protein
MGARSDSDLSITAVAKQPFIIILLGLLKGLEGYLDLESLRNLRPLQKIQKSYIFTQLCLTSYFRTLQEVHRQPN